MADHPRAKIPERLALSWKENYGRCLDREKLHLEQLSIAEARIRELEQGGVALVEQWMRQVNNLQAQLQAVTQERGRIKDELTLTRIAHVRSANNLSDEREAVAQLQARNQELESALRHISEWSLPDTGRKWDDGSPMSYGACCGSNGERDYMRRIANTAIAQEEKEKS
jgi:hypothetical protein